MLFILIPWGMIFLLAYFIQANLFLSPDVAYNLHSAMQLLSGGNYVTSFFETNPPLVIYLYIPAYLLAKWTAINIITAARIYIFSLAIISSLVCVTLLNKLISHQNKIIFYLMSYVILSILLILPLFELGQREHLFTIFLLPYLFSTVLSLENKPTSKISACLIGFFAGLGFALKPFFLVTFLLIEGYFCYKKRRILACLRPEALIIVSVLVAYLGVILLFHAQYISVILPLVWHFYFIGAKQSWISLFSKPIVVFCCAVLCSYGFFYKSDKYQTLDVTLLLALFGMIIAFIIPRTAWFYHILPAFSLALLIVTLCYSQLLVAYLKNKSALLLFFFETTILLLIGLFIFIVPIAQEYQVWKVGRDYKLHDPSNQLVNFINSKSGKHSIACFSARSDSDCFPLIYLTQSEYGSRYPLFWWYLGLRKSDEKKTLLEKEYLLNSVAQDLTHFQPQWVIVNSQYDNLIAYFLSNKEFRSAWLHYHLVRSIDYYQIYQRDSMS